MQVQEYQSKHFVNGRMSDGMPDIRPFTKEIREMPTSKKPTYLNKNKFCYNLFTQYIYLFNCA